MSLFSLIFDDEIEPNPKDESLRLVEIHSGWQLQVYDDDIEDDFGHWEFLSNHSTEEAAREAARVYVNPKIINLY